VKPHGIALLGAAIVWCVGCGGNGRPAVTTLHDSWEFRRVGDTLWLPASVPGAVHLDLLANGRIPDPFYRDNEDSLQWIEREDWDYRTTFRLSSQQLRERHHELVFEGLDTYATVLLNGVTLLASDNMFRRYEVDAGDALRAGDNLLEIRFRSPLAVELPLVAAHPYALPIDNDFGNPPTRVFTRKAAYQYGWDWGARFVTSGIWRPVALRSWSGVRIADVQFVQRDLSDARAELEVRVTVVADGTGPAEVRVRGRREDLGSDREIVQLVAGENVVAVPLAIAEPQRWWPRGSGPQHLYDLVVEVEANGHVDSAKRRVGLRALEVVTEADSIGESFYLRVNGVPLFMKGANYIPVDHFTTRVDETRYRALFEAAAAANINMLRVWGGGIYENDVFYDLADEYGILIWQDFMFANGMYPGDSAFLANVEAEVVDNVRRLRNHPSLALWCGNNEIDEAWHNWGWPMRYTSEQAASIWRTYRRIFHGILPDVVAEQDSGRFYWPSSPSLGWGHPESLTRGDSHYWGIWHGGEPFETFQEKPPRFMSEFGFQGYPALETVRAFALPEDFDLRSRVMQVHQKGGGALDRIDRYMQEWYRTPKDFESFLYVSQLLQAEGIKMGLVSHRRAKPRTMGTLYWQLNDTWPVASWSSFDYYGRWKALHYFVADAFAEVIVAPLVHGDTVEWHVVSDRLLPVSGVVEAAVYTFDGSEQWSLSVPVDVGANASRRVLAVPTSQLLAGADPRGVVLVTRLRGQQEVLDEDLLYFAKPKDLLLPAPEVSVGVEDEADGYRIVLESPVLAKNVYLSLDGGDGWFSDNYFDLVPGRIKTVTVTGVTGPTGANIRERLRVRTLIDTF